MTRARPSARSRAALAVACVVALAGCDKRAIESWLNQDPASGASTESAGPSLYDDDALGKALDEVKKRMPVASIQVLSLLVYRDHLVLQAQDPAASERVLQYVYRGGKVDGPVPVKLLGTGKLEDNLFPLESAKITAIPRLVKDAEARANIPEGSVARVLLKRNLPETMDVQFRVFVTSQRRDAALDADQYGKLID